MSYVSVEPAVVDATAANLLATAVQLQAAIIAATGPAVGMVPPGAEEVSITGTTALAGNNAQVLGMSQAAVVEMTNAALAVGGSGVAIQVQDLINKGLLLV
ncbi:PE domain-containing protein (plasmid) [Mycolicibacterium fortuitum]|nr:PE domain-containing protein [Mycolicibacterium fortuitum]